MNRIIATLSVLVALLVATDYWIHHARERERSERSLLRPLVEAAAEVVPERVRSIRIHHAANPLEWTYEKQGGHWRFPGHFDAYVKAERIDFLLRALLQTLGTVVSAEAQGLHRFGLAADQALQIALLDAQGRQLLEVQVGNGVTGAAAGEAYIKKSSVDTILHWHANPRHALDAGNPPMIDPLVLPQVLAPTAVSSIRFISGSPGSVTALRRLDEEPAQSPQALMAQHLEPTTVWLATFDGREDTCLNANVFAYSSFLTRVQYLRVHDPRQGGYGFVDGRRLEIVDEDGAVDVLDVGGAASKQTVYLRNRTAGMVFSIDRSKADLLFPTARLLLEPLPETSPYDSR